MKQIRTLLLWSLATVFLAGSPLKANWLPLQEDEKQELKKDQEQDQDQSEAEEAKKELTPIQKYREMAASYIKERNQFFAKLRAAKTAEERRELARTATPPNPNEFAEQMFELIDQHPDDKETAFQALGWVVTNVRQAGTKEKAMEMLLADHLDQKQLSRTFSRMAYSRKDKTVENYLKTIREKSPHESVQMMAGVTYANYRKRNASKSKEDIEEVTKLYEDLVEKFSDADIRGRSIEEIVEAPLFELKNLQIGMKAPNIVGEDVDGVEFELNDYLGKVVVIDFWGDW